MPESNTPINNLPDPDDDPAPAVQILNAHGLPIDSMRWQQVAREILVDHGFPNAELSLVIVDDSTIQELNRRYLNHDYPTDVLSFTLESDPEAGRLQGEVIVSADTAARVAEELSVDVQHELLLYATHGVLHLVGYDDAQPAEREQMRAAERRYLEQIGIVDHAWVGTTQRGAP